jgi:CTP:molybdopterin cytidylyltransferase MocA
LLGKYKSISAIILAAGESSRFKYPKAFLPFNSKATFIENILKDFIDFGCEKIIIVLNPLTEKRMKLIKVPSQVKIIYNPDPQLGRFYSLKLGCQALKNHKSCFMHNTDNPFLSKLLLKHLLDAGGEGKYVVPCYKRIGGHPVLLSAEITDSIKSFENIRINIKEFLNRFKRVNIETQDSKVLVNINSPEDYGSNFGEELLNNLEKN